MSLKKNPGRPVGRDHEYASKKQDHGASAIEQNPEEIRYWNLPAKACVHAGWGSFAGPTIVVTYFGIGSVRLSTALWFGGLGSLAMLIASTKEPLLVRIGLSVGMFLFAFFTTGYFHLILLSKNRLVHLYNWMLLPLFDVVSWKDVTGMRLVSYSNECREDLTATKMEVLGNCTPCQQMILWPGTQTIVLDESLINYIVLEVARERCVIPLVTLKCQKEAFEKVLMSVAPHPGELRNKLEK